MKRSPFIVIVVFFIFGVISLLSNILGPIIPDIIDSFGLSIGLAGFLPFSFFVAYGVMSIPAGILLDKYSNKTMVLSGFLLALLGALSFSLIPTFEVALISLFSIGVGMAMLQVVINPLLREAGGKENFAFNSVFAQLFFGAGSFISPLIYSFLVHNVHTSNDHPLIVLLNNLVPPDIKWISLYWVFTLTCFVVIVIIAFIRFPTANLEDEDRIDTGPAFRSLVANKYVLLYFLGIFCYVGTEQGIANWTSKFLQLQHGVDPSTTGATIISYFWGLMTLGCLGGLILLKLFDSRRVLIISTVCAMVMLAFGLFGPANVALICFPLTGLFLSVMWSIIISLGLNSVPRHHGTFSGILCTAIAGGAIVPLIIGGAAELVGLKFSMTILFLTLGYVLSIGLWAKPLVNNATIKSWREVFQLKFLKG
jgi:fucose permease